MSASTSLCCPFCHSTEFPTKVAFRNHRQFCEFVTNTVNPNTNELDAATTVAPLVYHQIVRNLVCEVTKLKKQIDNLSSTVAQMRRKQAVPLRTHLSSLHVPAITSEQWFDVNHLAITHDHLIRVFESGLVRGIVTCLESNFDSAVASGQPPPFATLSSRTAKRVYVFSGESSPPKWQVLSADTLLAHLKKMSSAFMTKYLTHTKETPPPFTETAVTRETQNMKSMVSAIRPADVVTVMRALYKKALTLSSSNVVDGEGEGEGEGENNAIET